MTWLGPDIYIFLTAGPNVISTLGSAWVGLARGYLTWNTRLSVHLTTTYSLL